jgi:hypothetical protein
MWPNSRSAQPKRRLKNQQAEADCSERYRTNAFVSGVEQSRSLKEKHEDNISLWLHAVGVGGSNGSADVYDCRAGAFQLRGLEHQ